MATQPWNIRAVHRVQLQHIELTVTTHSSWRRCTCKVIAVPSTSIGFRLKSVPTVALVSALNSLLQNWLTRQVLPVLREDRKNESKAGKGRRGREEHAMNNTSSQCLPCVAHNYDFSKDLIHSSLRLRFAHLRTHVTNDTRGDYPPSLCMAFPQYKTDTLHNTYTEIQRNASLLRS